MPLSQFCGEVQHPRLTHIQNYGLLEQNKMHLRNLVVDTYF